VILDSAPYRGGLLLEDPRFLFPLPFGPPLVFAMSIRRISGVLCSGNICFDVLVRPVDRLEWGTSTWVEDYIEEMGGNGSNTCYTLAMLGAPARLHGMVGRDSQGEWVLAKLRGAGVDLGAVGRSVAPTTTTICVVNSAGNRLFLQRIGSSNEAFAEPFDFDRALTGGHSHYHLANLFALPNMIRHGAEVLRRARQAGMTTSLDTGWDQGGRWMEALGPCLPFTDLLFVNEEESRMLTSASDPAAIARVFRDCGASDIALKLGARGCVIFSQEGELASPAFEVRAVDTTGAGDCFAGAFLAALQRGESYEQAARWANAVGAMVVERLGAVCGVRRYEETVAWMAMAGAAPASGVS
jgi:sugar/nucleoside kinase (ribokinase family)